MMEIVALYIVPCDVRVLTCFESGEYGNVRCGLET